MDPSPSIAPTVRSAMSDALATLARVEAGGPSFGEADSR